jgi:hypothetical protein
MPSGEIWSALVYLVTLILLLPARPILTSDPSDSGAPGILELGLQIRTLFIEDVVSQRMESVRNIGSSS